MFGKRSYQLTLLVHIPQTGFCSQGFYSVPLLFSFTYEETEAQSLSNLPTVTQLTELEFEPWPSDPLNCVSASKYQEGEFGQSFRKWGVKFSEQWRNTQCRSLGRWKFLVVAYFSFLFSTLGRQESGLWVMYVRPKTALAQGPHLVFLGCTICSKNTIFEECFLGHKVYS